MMIAGRGRGQGETATTLAEGFREREGSRDFQLRAFVDLILGEAAMIDARYDEAIDRMTRILRADEALGTRHWMFKTAVRDGLEAALMLGETARAERILVEADAIPPGGRSPTLDATIARFQARVMSTRADANDDDLDSLYASSESILRETGFCFDLAQVLLEHATWRSTSGRGRDVVPLAEEASSIFGELRAAPWLERASALRAAAMSA